ncbi:aminomethyl-transferring glycine dehydrogenase subunit GcvPA [Beggiatoa leptomitoformis]|uniref:Probable glycine dehydrogenase (decarboxylating) subunit 1 n=1 Tax=Beggiatoa leptomitoformis TaxID=288004 RepID=A0A2N9YFB8_9GAMM|nr:aminomethyl-transferring glycine dehydrogenase subunit GcvPA [Beggiatoa leptomitoformis]ALG68503.1 aminomethyl-transferring glycine dehydrogenase subunit GcvPA [Beggiatoa leptomitoformis]AUI69160.1 aminomethyl-transferring glycine dehydrogenase subunit GcvPA [Beggiatoa leptomitoformis]
MPYIPHTQDDIDAMLATIGIGSIEALFDEIPPALRCAQLDQLPPRLTEMEIAQLMRQRATQDGNALCFIGAGAYEHHIPAAVWEITTRGEFYSAYTPYQAEASQGTLQLLYEYQTMMTRLTGMDASNASLYDGASALAEAILMAVRLTKSAKANTVLLPATVHPIYRQVIQTLVKNQGIILQEIPYNPSTGTIDTNQLPQVTEEIAALVIPQPNFFGMLEAVDKLTDWAKANKLLVIAQVNPLTLAVLSSPDTWGEQGADIVCGEGQPLGIPLASGGPYFGFLCCKKDYVRQMPGRIIGRTLDVDGKEGFVLTLQAREQHIRRSKATSNICTNQGLMVTAATIYLSIMGAEGLERTALACHANTHQLVARLNRIQGVTPVFTGHYFHEQVLRLNKPVAEVLRALAAQGIWGGYDVSHYYPELSHCLSVCATETRTVDDIEFYATTLEKILAS